MKFKSLVPACLLLLWALLDIAAVQNIKVSTTLDAIKMTCMGKDEVFDINGNMSLELAYSDESTGEYRCKGTQITTIFVKFQTCDTCIELDTASIAGIAIGDAVATFMLGVAVYLVASLPGPAGSRKKTSNRQPPIDKLNRSQNDPYQRLRFKNGDRMDPYDVINNSRLT